MKNVALVLGSGGARGLAHIGAIEELEARGYKITSIAGCSMGSIIAGMYAAGKLKEAKKWFLTVDKQLILKMLDVNFLSGNSIVKGQRIIEELKTVVPDQLLEKLPIPCSLVAADMISTEQVVFTKGSLFEAIRASISIPLFFEPVQRGRKLLIDGGVLNPLPLNVVKRKKGDILVAADISGKDKMKNIQTRKPELIDISKPIEYIQSKGIEVPEALEEGLHNLADRVNRMRRERASDLRRNIGFFGLLDRMNDMQIQQNTILSLQLTPPDVHSVMPQYAYNTFDFDKAEEIIEQGRLLMRDALNRYER
ncbi:MAG: patatin-like phospholipase family protein [Paludibacteraceae bacterium]|nr:patatin-like phospholipase family protein [Paludibacteraceae bacterium]